MTRLEEAKRAIRAVHEDMGVPLAVTLEGLKDLKELVDFLIPAVEEDIRNEERRRCT